MSKYYFAGFTLLLGGLLAWLLWPEMDAEKPTPQRGTMQHAEEPRPADDAAAATQPRQTRAWLEQQRAQHDALAGQTGVAISVSPECEAQSGIRASESLRQNLRRRLAIDLAATSAHHLFFTERSRYWQLDQQHYQLTAVWERDQPARYRMAFYSARDGDFANALRMEPLPDLPASGLDALSVVDLQERIYRDYQQRGASDAGTHTVARQIDQAAGEQHEITLFDGEVLQWAFPQGACLVDENAPSMNCQCDQEPSPA